MYLVHNIFYIDFNIEASLYLYGMSLINCLLCLRHRNLLVIVLTATDTNNTLTLSGVNFISDFFVDGVNVSLPHLYEPLCTNTISLPVSTKRIEVHVDVVSLPYGFLASIKCSEAFPQCDQAITDDTRWECAKRRRDGSIKKWRLAIIEARQGQGLYPRFGDISPDAYWIWVRDEIYTGRHSFLCAYNFTPPHITTAIVITTPSSSTTRTPTINAPLTIITPLFTTAPSYTTTQKARKAVLK